uniref:HhH-GPD domain-containing protein n=1 Tax=Zooxanthella nutricula TaxID=1333877 RepID=A0A7S2VS36_9DINO
MGLSRKTSFSHGIEVKQGRKTKVTRTVSKSKAVRAAAPKQRQAPKGAPRADRAGGGNSAAGSPFVGFARPTPADVTALHRVLAAVFGERRPIKSGKKRDILGTVVGTILSQNTTNTNSHAAYTNLTSAFKTWDKVRLAKPSAIEAAIRCGGLAPKKTKWIQHICRTLYKERGETSLEYLRNESKESVHALLERFTGVGKKTVAIINLFDVGHPDMAVDTHVFRYAEQLGWVPSADERAAHNAKAKSAKERWPVVTRDTAYAHLDAVFPDRLKYSMHLILTDTTGGLPTVCTARDTLSFDGKGAYINDQPLREVVRLQGLK